MLIHNPNLRIWLYAQPTDMRKQFDGLAALAKNKMGGQIDHQHLFVFINRKRTQIKLLYFGAGGLCLWTKRQLEWFKRQIFVRKLAKRPGSYVVVIERIAKVLRKSDESFLPTPVAPVP